MRQQFCLFTYRTGDMHEHDVRLLNGPHMGRKKEIVVWHLDRLIVEPA